MAEKKFRWLPNQITALRIVPFSALIVVLFLIGGSFGYGLAFVCYLIYSILDKVDGMRARNGSDGNGHSLKTKFGGAFDPFVDKLTIVSLYILFTYERWMKGWMVVLIFARELTVSFYRSIGCTGKAKLTGQGKTLIQMIHQHGLLLAHAINWAWWLEYNECFNWIVTGCVLYSWIIYTPRSTIRTIRERISKLDHELEEETDTDEDTSK